MLDLKAKPFYLNEEDITWVEETLAPMTLEQKAGQVFCPMGFSADPGMLHHLICDIGVGGLVSRAWKIKRILHYLQTGYGKNPCKGFGG